MLELTIGVSALQAAQRALEVAGNNVSNANTPGYHRQLLQLESATPMQLGDQSIGRGVSVTDIQRAVSQQLETALTEQSTLNGYIDSRQSAMTQLQSSIPTDGSSPAAQLGTLFNDLQQVASQLNSGAASRVALSGAQSLARRFQSLASSLDQMRTGLDRSIRGAVDAINPMLKEIANLNTQIATLKNRGIQPNDLLDQRDQLVNTVAQKIPLQIQDAGLGQVTLLQSGSPLVIAGEFHQLTAALDSSGQMAISVTGSNDPLTITSGELGGMLDVRNTQLPDYRSRLETLAHEVSRAFDAIQTTGLGVSGGFKQLIGQRGVNSVSAPLNAAGLTFPPQAGTLFIGLTNAATGQRTMTEIAIDPATQSLQDVANSIGAAMPSVQAFVNNQTGTLSMFASPGYTFDFTGGVDTVPTTSFSAGTTTAATVGGAYSGAANDSYTFTFLSNGTVGVTVGLQAQVTNQAGDVIATVNVGQGYEAGQPIDVADGVTLTLGPGNVVAGDSLTSRVVGQPDSAGILTALGLNTFFTGSDASSMAVNSQLVANPGLLATSRTGQPGDSSNVQRFLALRDSALMTGGTQTLTQYFNQMVSDVGTDVQSLNQQHDTNQLLMTRLQAQQQSVSGVDINEEMVQVIKYQQMFQSAAKYISTVNDLYQQLFQSL